MQMRAQLEALIDEMLEGQILLDEAVAEFEKLYIKKALPAQATLTKTAKVLGIHRNTLSKRVAAYTKKSAAHCQAHVSLETSVPHSSSRPRRVDNLLLNPYS